MCIVEKNLSLLGMARRAGILIIGQDSVKSSLARREKLFIMFPEDAPRKSQKTFLSLTKYADNYAVLEGVSIERLGSAIGVERAVVVALPEQSGFVSKIKSSLNHLDSIEGGVAIGQSENIRTCQNFGTGQQGDDENSL
jgi:ribosomal protein L7Ae-like RNA K-turn-binding protein